MHIKSEQKVNNFVHQWFKKNAICVGRVWIVLGYFLFEKQTLNGLLKVIGIQKNCHKMTVLIHSAC